MGQSDIDPDRLEELKTLYPKAAEILQDERKDAPQKIVALDAELMNQSREFKQQVLTLFFEAVKGISDVRFEDDDASSN